MVGYQRVYPTFALFSGGSDTYPFFFSHASTLICIEGSPLHPAGFLNPSLAGQLSPVRAVLNLFLQINSFLQTKNMYCMLWSEPPNLWRWHPRTFRRWTSQFFSIAILHFQFPPPFNCSFRPLQELVNVENTPMLLAEAVERVRPMCGGQNFSWERSHGSYGGKLHINFPIAAGTMVGPCDGRIPQIQRKV